MTKRKGTLRSLIQTFDVFFCSRSFKKIGSQAHTLPELFQAHKKTELSGADKARISDILVDLYKNGLSLTDISRQTGKAKNTIRDELLRREVKLRSKISVPVSKAVSARGKLNIRPYYGFCYFLGAVTPDPREFEILTLIHRLWSSGNNPNRIAETLNEKSIPARSAAKWNRNSVVNIVTRFAKKQIVLSKGGKYELR